MNSYCFQRVLEMGKNDEIFMSSFVEQSTEELSSYLTCIKEGVESKNAAWLRFIEHKSRPVFKLVNGSHLSNTIAALAKLAEKGNWEMDDKVQMIEQEISHLIERIQTELKPELV